MLAGVQVSTVLNNHLRSEGRKGEGGRGGRGEGGRERKGEGGMREGGRGRGRGVREGEGGTREGEGGKLRKEMFVVRPSIVFATHSPHHGWN